MKSLGFVFPGQGSQSVGMLMDIAQEYPEVQDVFAEASDVLDYNLWHLVQDGPAEELNKTVHTQPALLAASYALWKIITSNTSVKPIILAGHSLGEYTALTCANAIKFTDAIRLVAARGHFMQEAVPVGEGALAAVVGLDDEAVENLCKKAALTGEVLTPANFNSPGQVVIAGQKIAVERALVLAKESGAKLAKLLPVSVPSHCALMKPAADRLADILSTIAIKSATIPVLSNVDVEEYTSSGSICDGLLRQLFMPVRWVEIIQSFAKAGVTQVIECGPGKVLTGLNKRILPDIQLANTSDLASLQVVIETLRG